MNASRASTGCGVKCANSNRKSWPSLAYRYIDGYSAPKAPFVWGLSATRSRGQLYLCCPIRAAATRISRILKCSPLFEIYGVDLRKEERDARDGVAVGCVVVAGQCGVGANRREDRVCKRRRQER